VQPYGLIGVGLIKTKVEDKIFNVSDSKNQIGWTIGGGVIIYLQSHLGVKGDIRYYHSFESFDLLGFDVLRGSNIDFGRAGLGMVFKF
jgi:opacity protein-like surface antigen